MTTTAMTPNASNIVNAVCVEVEELGTVATPFGDKPQVKVTFDSDVLNEHGGQRRFVRTFNKFFNDKSALSIAVKSWLNRDLAIENETQEDVNLQSLVGQQAKLKLEPIVTKSGNPFDKVAEILPPGTVKVQPSNRKEKQD